jgi:transposase-like protein
MVYLWGAVDAEGEVLDVLIQSKRNKHAALKLMRKLPRKYAVVPERMVTEDLRSYRAATLDLGIDHLHDRGRWKNNRAENSHQPTRHRVRKMQRFKSVGSAQKFLPTHAAGVVRVNFRAVPAVLASAHEQSVPIFQRLAGDHPAGRDDVRAIPLSPRNVEDLLAERGIDISHETVRLWWNRFGPMFAAEIRKQRVAHLSVYPQWRFHLDELFVKVNGRPCYLWRSVDHEG